MVIQMAEAMNECVLEWFKGDSVASVTMPANTRLYNRIKKLALENPCVQVLFDKNGSMLARIPTAWIKINHPRKVSAARREELMERLQGAKQAESDKPDEASDD